GGLDIIRQIDHFFQQGHVGMARGVPPDGVVDFIVHTEHVPGDGRAGLGVEKLQGLLLQLVQLDAVPAAQFQLLLHVQLFCAVVQQCRYPGLLHIGAVPLRQTDGLLLRAQHVGDALVFQITQSYRPQLPQGQALQIRPGAVQSLPQDIAVHRRRQEIHALSLRQHGSQVCGGHIHHAGDGEGEDPGLGICPVQIVPLNGEQLLRVRLRSAEGGDPRQGQNLLRFVPGLDGEEHVRAHQQPQLVLRVPLLQLG
ncbi:tRNA pseudouridine(38-40) synthase TruA, partial [Dysosmobacter welbionis]